MEAFQSFVFKHFEDEYAIFSMVTILCSNCVDFVVDYVTLPFGFTSMNKKKRCFASDN